jgi:cytochrome c-type biogenesis protein CcmH
MLWVIFALLTGAAVFSVLWPLSRAPTDIDARELDVAFYKAQTAEIERDTARGVIAAAEADVARTEAARRLLSASQRPARSLQAASPWAIRSVALGALVLVPAIALGLYWQIGAPNLPDQPLQARLEAPPAKMDLPTAIARIEQHLRENPDDGRGWTILAPIYVRLQRYDDAARAYDNVIRVMGPTAERYATLGEVQVFAGGGRVTADARRSFDQAQKLDPKSPRAGFYLGLAAEQDGEKPKAVAIWRKLIADSPPDAPWLPTVRTHIAEASGEAPSPAAPGADVPRGPMAAAVAAMPPDQQQAMIHRMVDKLEERLKTNGKDIEGWMRLVRSYRVLNEQNKAMVALTDARRNFAADPVATKQLDELARELGLEG